MRISAQLVSKTLGLLAKEIKPGITTQYLDKIAEEFIRDNNAEQVAFQFEEKINDYYSDLAVILKVKLNKLKK